MVMAISDETLPVVLDNNALVFAFEKKNTLTHTHYTLPIHVCVCVPSA